MGSKDLYRKITAALRRGHYVQIPGGKGSHEKWKSEITGHITTVPPSTKSRHTANNIMKDCGLPDRF